jgi:hypothetical protein
MLGVLSDYMKYMNLSWMSCVGICTDDAPSVTGAVKQRDNV